MEGLGLWMKGDVFLEIVHLILVDVKQCVSLQLF
jgi:hypothetical protein